MKAKRTVAWGLCALGLGLGAYTLFQAFRPLPDVTKGDVARGADAFYHSDLGSARYGAVLAVVFDAIPKLVPEELPEGWAGVGFVWPDGAKDGPPIGLVPGKIFGMDVYSPNCAICHAGRFDGKLVAGLPNADLDVQRVRHAIEVAFSSGKLTTGAIAQLAEAAGKPLNLAQKLVVAALLQVIERAFATRAPGWFHDELGPGRSDALAGWKETLGLIRPEDVTWVDLPPIFNQGLKERTLYDGSITGDPATRVMLTELQKGRPLRDPLLHREVFDDIAAYMTALKPPPYPYPVDKERAAAGQALFTERCEGCHGRYGDAPTYPNKRIPLDKIGTDPLRAQAMNAAVAQKLTTTEYQRFLHIDPAPAYLAPALNGVYLSAPYLHNGSVPTLWHLLSPESERPVSFYRRWNRFDQKLVGLACAPAATAAGPACGMDASQAAHDPRTVFLLDTRKPGNRNTGHRYGTDLPDEEKIALLEYLKTI